LLGLRPLLARVRRSEVERGSRTLPPTSPEPADAE
jgi:hypothetical protein